MTIKKTFVKKYCQSNYHFVVLLDHLRIEVPILESSLFTGNETASNKNDEIDKKSILGSSQCDQIWRNFATLANLQKTLAILGEVI